MIRRILLAVAFAAGSILLNVAHARAASEFCPATLAGRIAQVDTAHVRFRLGALSERTVTGFLRLKTDTGWFSVPFFNVRLARVPQSYDFGGFSFSYTDFVSPDIVVQFPSAANVRYAYVSQGSAKGETVFGWDAKGTVACLPTPLTDAKTAPLPPPPLPAIGGDAIRLMANPMDDPFLAKCENDAASIHMIKAGAFHMPALLSHDNFSAQQECTTGVVIAVGADGSVLDAWLWETSGTPLLDNAVLDEAKASTFEPGRMFCINVPGFYLLRSFFKP